MLADRPTDTIGAAGRFAFSFSPDGPPDLLASRLDAD
jgi:hypothetical protein